jgi:hypothetical protein
MSSSYRIFYVSTLSAQTGKSQEAMTWFDQGMRVWRQLPGVKSVQSYAVQFGLSQGETMFEVWTEIQDYSVLDAWDRIDGPLRAEWLDLMAAGRTCVTWGPARLMGDLAGSTPEELGGELSPKA